MTLNAVVKGSKKVERKMFVLLTTETVGKYCESLFQSYLLPKWHTIPFSLALKVCCGAER